MIQETTRRRPSAARSTLDNIDAETAFVIDRDPIALQSFADSAAGPARNRNHETSSAARRKYLTSPLLATCLAIFFATSIWISFSLDLNWKDMSVGSFGDLLKSSQNENPSEIAILHPEEHAFRQPKTKTWEWEVTTDFRYPDGVRKRVYLINDQFPGPTIEARSGDTLIIHVKNSIPNEGLSLHWHGLHMKGFNHMDGAVGITQSTIPSGESLTYAFRLSDDQHGTFWYHAHSQNQRGDGLYGGMVIHQPVESDRESHYAVDDIEIYEYEKEVLLMVGDWYHRSADEMLGWFTSTRGFGNEPVPDSLLINGVGNFNCSKAVPARPVECIGVESRDLPSLLEFDQKSPIPSLRLRIVNTGSLAGFSFRVTGAEITPIEIDGGSKINSISAIDSVGILYPGERVDVIVKWDNGTSTKPQDSSFEITLDPENFKYPNPALTPKQSFPMFSDSSSLPNRREFTSDTNVIPQSPSPSQFFLRTATSSHPPLLSIPRLANQTVILYTKTLKLAKFGNHPKGFINQTSWSPQDPPLVTTPRELWDKNQFIVSINHSLDSDEPFWVDVIINNLDDGGHPFHLHGHSFYVLQTHRSERGWGSYKYDGNGFDFDFEGKEKWPVLKDTVLVPRRGHAVIRFLADNKGIWMLHCHMLVHLGSGMAMGFEVVGG